LQEITLRKTRHARVFLPPLAVGIVAEAARLNHRFLAPVRHYRRHGRVVVWKPVGRPVSIANLRERE
jgi:hypothetical protein